MQLISTVTVGAGGAAVIQFANIPQTFDDLLILLSLRSAYTGGADSIGMYFNGVQTNLTNRSLYGNGSGVTSSSSTYRAIAAINSDFHTSNTFTNVQIYVPNYKTSLNKTISVDAVMENNALAATQTITAETWASTAAITQILFDTATSGLSFKQYSSASLYGITAADRSLLWDFLSGTEGFTTNASTISASGGILTWTPTAGDPFLISPAISVSGLSARYIKIKWKRSVVAQSTSWAGQIFYSTPGHGYSEGYTKFIPQPTWTSDYQTTVIDMGVLNAGGADYTSNMINAIRLDFTNGSDGASYLIDSIELSSKP